MLPGCAVCGDSGISIDERPEWLNLEKFYRGQKFAAEHFFQISYSQMLSLFLQFSIGPGLDQLVATNRSSTPYTAFNRYLSTINRVYNWMTTDPWVKNSPAYKDTCYVRRIHDKVRKDSNAVSNEEFLAKIEIKNPYCPALSTMQQDFQSISIKSRLNEISNIYLTANPNLKVQHVNQTDMAFTQFSFMGLITLKPKDFGLHYASDEDLEAFIHVWKGIGYLLGIEDRFNFCRGTLADVRVRTVEMLEYQIKPKLKKVTPSWEHMTLCVIEGVTYFFPGLSYKSCLLHLFEIIDIRMLHLYKTASYYDLALLTAYRYGFKYGSKIAGFNKFLTYLCMRLIQRGTNFDETKHKELQNKSLKTLSFNSIKILENKVLLN